MIAHVDINNFYASVERMFDPALEGRPIVVLSNNDGSVIARSNEAKEIGIEKGTPAYSSYDFFNKNNVAVLSSNYTLYGSMSERVMTILKSFVEKVEVYSIDEAFMDLTQMRYADHFALATDIRRKIMEHTGLGVTVGVGATKALAKMATHYVKKKKIAAGVYVANTDSATAVLLTETKTAEIWGIGEQYTKLLSSVGVTTAADLIALPDDWMRSNMSVVGLRLMYELRGIPAIRFDDMKPPKKNICTSRSFGVYLNSLKELEQPVAAHTSNCAKKLRQDNLCAKKINVFIQTNPFNREHTQYFTGITIPLPTPTNSTHLLIRFAMNALKRIYKAGYHYMKAGVMLLDLVPDHTIQMSLFGEANHSRDRKIMQTLDRTNQDFGKNMLRYGTHAYETKWHLRTMHLSPRYTTRLDQIMKVKS